jgi:serine/threonine protein kinase
VQNEKFRNELSHYLDEKGYIKFWDNEWKVDFRFCKNGRYGSVYKIFNKFGNTYQVSALKKITIPNIEDFKEGKTYSSNDLLKKDFFNDYKKVCTEIESLIRLKGKRNIVQYEAKYIEEKDTGWDIFIRMEFLQSLSDFLKKKNSLDFNGLLKIGINICEALEVCKKNKIIHKDIKPDNIFFADDFGGYYKLGDFGISKFLNNNEFLRTTTVEGTENYIAPEIWGNKYYDYRADQYSLAAVLNELFVTYKCEEKIKNVDLLNRYKNMISKATSYKPEERFNDPSEFKQELERIMKLNQVDDSPKRLIFLKRIFNKKVSSFLFGLVILIVLVLPNMGKVDNVPLIENSLEENLDLYSEEEKIFAVDKGTTISNGDINITINYIKFDEETVTIAINVDNQKKGKIISVFEHPDSYYLSVVDQRISLDPVKILNNSTIPYNNRSKKDILFVFEREPVHNFTANFRIGFKLLGILGEDSNIEIPFSINLGGD